MARNAGDARQAKAGLGSLAIIAAGTFIAAAGGAFASARAPAFYQALAKPPWAPPPTVFGPVWTVLYVLIAIAAWLVVRELGWNEARYELILFAAQLVANGIWTWLFFSLHSGVAAFVDIIVLDALVIATLVTFWRAKPLAGALFVPYLAWVCFASALTWSVWMRNPIAL